jgi:hypothetical protein
MYSEDGRIRLPSSTNSAPLRRFRSASFLVGSSSPSPLRKIRSASERTSATLGAGSNVCEFVPSGTTPVISARSPATLAAMLVIGATLVTTFSLARPACRADADRPAPPSLPQAVLRARMTARRRAAVGHRRARMNER